MNRKHRFFCAQLFSACLILLAAPAGAQESVSVSELQAQHRLLGQELEALHIDMLQLQTRQAALIERMQTVRTRYDALNEHIGKLSPATQAPVSAAPLPEPKPANPAPITSPTAQTQTQAEPPAQPRHRSGSGLISVRYVYENAAKARAALAELNSRGVNAYSAEGQGSYRVYLGAYLSERIALQKAREFGELLGVEPEIYFPD